jgi:hypothetical protein
MNVHHRYRGLWAGNNENYPYALSFIFTAAAAAAARGPLSTKPLALVSTGGSANPAGALL